MPVKLKIEDLHERLLGSDIFCSEKVYRNPHLKMKFECNQGHSLNISWSDVRKFINQKQPHCPVCKHGEKYLERHQDILKKKERIEYKSHDGKTFNTRKELIQHERKLKAKTVPHEIAIHSISKTLKNAKRYYFKRSVIETIAKWNTIWKLREKAMISKNEVPEKSQIKKEMHKAICSNCDGDPQSCGCNEKHYTEYGFVEGNLKDTINFIPDLFIIDEESYEISAIEVEDKHRVPIAKIVEYAFFFEALDWSFPDWTFHLFIYDRFANRMGEINLPVYYHATLSDDFSDNYKTILEEWEDITPRIESEILGYYKSAKFTKF